MNAVTLLEKLTSPGILETGALIRELIHVPRRGATEEEIREEESKAGRPFSEAYRRFLRRWNGMNLDVIRLFGMGDVDSGVERWAHGWVPEHIPHLLAIGSDPAGFVYAEDSDGAVYSIDHDGGEVSCVARDFDNFVVDYVFGKDSAYFGGVDWARDVNEILKGEA